MRYDTEEKGQSQFFLPKKKIGSGLSWPHVSAVLTVTWQITDGIDEHATVEGVLEKMRLS
jgi:hypothetical protein